MNILKACAPAALAIALSSQPTAAQTDRIQIPELGDTYSGVFSLEKEKLLGDMWLRMFRAQAPTVSDPLIYSYTINLIDKLARHSELQDKNIELVIVADKNLNAFAVPGGVMGINAGLFIKAENEAQFASVVGHELAHLSQRHFVRRMEKQQQMTIPMLAAMLASVLVASSGSGDAGMAGVMATQALAKQVQLNFSRSNEQEADRIGIRTLVDAGYSADAAGDMFEHMQRALRFTKRPPEYLLSHPMTEKRISDARLRARSMPKHDLMDSFEYQLMRARISVLVSSNSGFAARNLRAEIEGEGNHIDAKRYGLALAYSASGEHERADKLIDELIEKHPQQLIFKHAKAELAAKDKRFIESNAILDAILADHPSDLAANVRYAENLMAQGEYTRSEKIIRKQIRYHAKNEHLWYLLAEVSGLSGNILETHKARAEYFSLLGALDQSIKHLRLALKLTDDNYIERSRIQARLEQVMKMMRDLEDL